MKKKKRVCFHLFSNEWEWISISPFQQRNTFIDNLHWMHWTTKQFNQSFDFANEIWEWINWLILFDTAFNIACMTFDYYYYYSYHLISFNCCLQTMAMCWASSTIHCSSRTLFLFLSLPLLTSSFFECRPRQIGNKYII